MTRYRIAIVVLIVVAGAIGIAINAGYEQRREQQRLDRDVASAAQKHAFDAVRALVLKGANPDGAHAPNPDGSMSYPYHPPIVHACEAGDLETVRFLIDHGVDLSKDGLDATLLARAAYNNDRPMIELLLDRGADPDKSPRGSFDYNLLALIVDLEWRDTMSTDQALALMTLAVDHGADPNRHGMHGRTPLLDAVCNQSHELTAFLLDQGGSVSAVCDDGWNAMDYATFRADAQLMVILARHGAAYNVQAAASLGRLDDVKRFVEQESALVTASYLEGHSLLGIALKEGHQALAEYLVGQGSDLNHTNLRKKTLLHLAARGNNAPMVTYLIEQGLDVNARDAGNSTPLHDTTFSDRAEAAAALIRAGADVNARASSQITPTIWASSYDSPRVLRLLLEAGCDPNAHGTAHRSVPLGSACHYANNDSVPASVKVLIEFGADVNRIGSKGRPAIHWAVEWFGGVPLVTYLLDRGANPLIADDNGENALDI
ncbi:MAG: ankyrin repeat domain-containing protein, partial [Phycisphaeraceae bacterium]